MSTVVQDRLVNQIRNRLENPNQIQNGSETKHPRPPAAKVKLHRTKSPNPPKPIPYREYATKKKGGSSSPECTEELSESTSTPNDSQNPAGYATVLVHPRTDSVHTQNNMAMGTKTRDGKTPREYEMPMPNSVAKKRDYERGTVGGDKKHLPPRVPPPTRSQIENEKLNRSSPETKATRSPQPVKTTAPPTRNQEGERKVKRESPLTSSANHSDDSNQGIKSLISKFDDRKGRCVSDGEPQVTGPPKCTANGQKRKGSAPDLFPNEQATPPSTTPIQEEDDEFYIHMRNEDRPSLGKRLLELGTSRDSGFSDVIEGSSPPETTPPQLDQNNFDNGTKNSSAQARHVYESQEDKIRRSIKRRGLISDGILLQQDPKETGNMSSGAEGMDEHDKTKTLDSLTSDGYLKVLPGQHIPPPKAPVVGTQDFNSLMEAVGIKDGKDKRIGLERKKKNHFRKLSDPAIKALKVALDAEASRRAIDDFELSGKQRKGGGGGGKKSEADDSPTTPPKEKSKLFSKLTRAVRGNKKEESHSNGTKDMKKSHSLSSAKTNRIIMSFEASEELGLIQEESEVTPTNDPHTRVWEDRLDLQLRPPAPLPRRIQDEIYAYAKMPFRRNQRVSVKIAGLRPLRHTTSVPIETRSLTDDTPKHTKASSEIIEPPPPIYPKSRSIKRSILINQGFDVNRIKDWNRSITDLMTEKKRSHKGITNPEEHPLECSLVSAPADLEDMCQVYDDIDPPLIGLGDMKRSSSLSEDISREIHGSDPYYLLVKKPSMLQHLLSTSVEVLFKTSEEDSHKDSAKEENDPRSRAKTMPSSLQQNPKYENFDDLSNYVTLEENTLRTKGKNADLMDDYIKMNRGRLETHPPPSGEKTNRYMNIAEAMCVLNEDELDIPDYIKMNGVKSNPLVPPFGHQMSTEGYVKCRTLDMVASNDPYMTFHRQEVGLEEEVAQSPPVKSSYMNWVELPEEYNCTIGTKTDSNSETAGETKLQPNPKQSSQKKEPSPPLVPRSYYAYLPPEEGEDIVEVCDLGEEGCHQRRESIVIKSEEQQQADVGSRYMNFEMAEQSFVNYPMTTKKVPHSEKLPMPSPRKASLSRRKPINSLHPDIPFSKLPQELQDSLNLQWQRKSIVSVSSDTGETPPSPVSKAMKSPGGYCVVSSACEEFTHMGGVLKPREECGIYIEVPRDAIKKNTTQKIWFVACYDAQYPGTSWQKAGTLARNSSDEMQLLEEDGNERDSRTTTTSPLIYIGPSDAEVLKPLKVHLPHCVSFQESSLRCWLEAKCYEMPRWATVCQRSFFHTPPKDKQFVGTRQSYKPQIVFQLLPTSAIIKTSHLGWFRLRGSGFRGAKKAAKRMFASIFQRVPNEYNPGLTTINEDEDEPEIKAKKDSTPKTELLVVISNDLPYVAEVIQWILERGTNKYVCLERYMPFKYCANGRDCEVILYGSSKTPIQTTSVPFGNLWRMKKIGEGWQILTVRTPDKYKDKILTFSLKQGDFPKQYARNISMNDY